MGSGASGPSGVQGQSPWPPEAPRTAAVIPVLNEAGAIGPTLRRLPRDIIGTAIVVDGGSTDGTQTEARDAGAILIEESRRGYGRACQTGADHAAAIGADIIIFMDGDGADAVEQVAVLLAPLLAGNADFVLADRTGPLRDPGSMGPHQILAGRLIGGAVGLMTG
ncbi:MAG TPA: glycosyltransferase family 2 protein, partial [Acetobacteraceae bacterium]|nr:glycosyltransferase family 2 protein [Acetobacteraceae bacterium]